MLLFLSLVVSPSVLVIPLKSWFGTVGIRSIWLHSPFLMG